jgi:hypothetical protein
MSGIVQHEHQWVPWNEHRLTVCDGDDGCTAALSWDGPWTAGYLDWTEWNGGTLQPPEPTTSVTDVPTWDRDVSCDRPRTLRQRVQRLACWVGRHRWSYFIDGSICRTCTECRHVEYDLPTRGPR